jgi:hypothetical protein
MFMCASTGIFRRGHTGSNYIFSRSGILSRDSLTIVKVIVFPRLGEQAARLEPPRPGRKPFRSRRPMASRLADSVIDNGLASLKSAARYVYLCSAEPQSYAEATSSYDLGVKDLGAGNVFPGAIEPGTGGRKVNTAAFSDGSVTDSGTASHWAITDASALLANGQLSAPQGVVALTRSRSVPSRSP